MFDANIRLICYNVKKTNITIGLKMIILSAVCDVACLARQYVGYQPERACLRCVKDTFRCHKGQVYESQTVWVALWKELH